MNILAGAVDLYLILRNITGNEILQMLGNEMIDLNGRYDVAGDTVYHAILRNKRLKEEEIIAISRIFRERGVNPATLNRNAKSPLYLAIENRMRDVADFFITYNPRLPGNDYAVTRFFVEDENKQFWRQARENYYTINLWDSEEVETESAKFFKWLIANEFHENSEDDDELIMLLHLAVDCNLQHILPVLLDHASERSITNPEHQSLLHLYLKKHAHIKKVQSYYRSRDWYFDYTSRYTIGILETLLDKGAVVDLSSVKLAVEEIQYIVIIKRMVNRLPNGGDEIIFASILNELIRYPDDSALGHYQQTLSILIAKGANVNASDSSGTVPLQVAFATKNAHAILWLMSVNVDFTVLTNIDDRPLHSLFAEGWCREVQQSVLRCAIPDDQLNARDQSGSTPLLLAVKFGDAASVKRLIERGADVNCRDENMRTPLHYAAVDRDISETTELLLKKGANANAKDVDGVRPLFRAIYTADFRYLDEEQLRTLFRRVPPNLVDSHESFLMKKVHVTRLLLRNGAQPNALRDLEVQATTNELVVKKLLEHGLAIDDSIFCRSLFEHSARSGLVLHWIKLRAANLPCYDGYEALAAGDGYQRCYEECLREVETLKETFVDSRTSFYRFLHLDPNRRCIYITNEKLRSLVNSSKLEEQFPEYAAVISGSYREAVTRKALLQPAKEAWLELTEVALPDICVERILSYLSNVDFVDMVGSYFGEV